MVKQKQEIRTMDSPYAYSFVGIVDNIRLNATEFAANCIQSLES